MDNAIFKAYKNSRVIEVETVKPNMFQIHWFEVEGHGSWELIHENKTEQQFKNDFSVILNTTLEEYIKESRGYLDLNRHLAFIVKKLVEMKGYKRPEIASLGFGDMNGDYCDAFRDIASQQTWKKIQKYMR